MNTIIFDMFGVIAKDPEANLMPYIKKEFSHHSVSDIEHMWQEAACGRVSSIDFFKKLGFEKDIEEIEKDYLDTVEIDESFFEAAEKLKSRFKLVLLSNDISEWSRYVRQKFGLDQYFDELVISGDCGFLKPDIKIYEHLLSRINEPAINCCFIDDRARNLETAKMLGMKVVLFNRKDTAYPGKSVNSFEELNTYLMES